MNKGINSVYNYTILDIFLFIVFLYMLYFVKQRFYFFKKNKIISIIYDIFNIIFYPIVIYLVVRFLLYYHGYIFYIFEALVYNKYFENNSDIKDIYMSFINVMFKISDIIYLFCGLLILRNAIIYIYKCKSISFNTHQEVALKSILKIVEFVIMFFIVLFILYISNVDIKTIFTTIITPLATIMYFLKNKINNILNGAIFVLSNTYQKNDFISIQQLNITGFIEKITLSNIYIQIAEGNIINIPISTFLENNIIRKNTIGLCNLVMNVDIVNNKDTIYPKDIIDILSNSKIPTQDGVNISTDNIIIKSIQKHSITVILYYSINVKTFKEYNLYKNIVFQNIHYTIVNNNYECEKICEIK